MTSTFDNYSAPLVPRIAEHAQNAPGSVAVKCVSGSLTYQQLDEVSAVLAHQAFNTFGPGNEPILVFAGHDHVAVAAFVAVSKSGRPAVFLDSTQPVERLRQIAELSAAVGAFVAPANQELADKIGSALGKVMPVEVDPKSQQHTCAVTDCTLPTVGKADILTICFTSGSTGIPKGVIIGGSALLTELGSAPSFTLDPSDRVGMPHTLSFFAGVAELTRVLAAGASLHLYDPRRQGLDGMVDWIQTEALTDLRLTPHLMRSVAQAAIRQSVVFESLRMVASAGEALPSSDVALLRQCTPSTTRMINATGSSEGWIVSIHEFGAADPLPEGTMPGGKSVEGKRISLRTPDGAEISEPDQLGEIFIVGPTMSGGYWRDPERTAERFSEDADGLRVYRTGDMGRWTSEGWLMYAGRADHMLKIRGYLVEPAEVEKHLMANGELVEAVVVGAQEQGSHPVRLVAYVVPSARGWVSAAALRRRLAGVLPTYMVPQTIVELTSLPRNANGKVDRLALPEPVQTAPAGSPKRQGWNSLQLVIGGICNDALGLTDIGLHDDLLELGADSLATEEIIAALKSEVGLKITSTEFAANCTINELTRLGRSANATLTRGVLTQLAGSGSGDATPVFLVAGAGSLALQFRELARVLGADRRVYGLQAFHLEGNGKPDFTIVTAARRYVGAIREVQPSGPYLLAGHSMGGVLAIEIARQLVAAGERIASLVMLDVILAEGVDADATLERVLPGRDFSELRDGQTGNPVLRFVRNRFFSGSKVVTRRFVQEWRRDRYAAFFLLGADMVTRYRWPTDQVAVDSLRVLRARDDAEMASPDWAAYVRAPICDSEFAGDHLSMLRLPFVEALGQRLRLDLAADDTHRSPKPVAESQAPLDGSVVTDSPLLANQS